MTGRDGEAGFRSDMQVEQLGDARHDDLDADAEGEEGDHFVDDDAAAVADFADDPFALRQEQIKYQAHQYDDQRDDRVGEQAPRPAVLHADRRHQRQDDRDAARADADGKGDRVEDLRLDGRFVNGVDVLALRPSHRGVRIAEPLQGGAADQQSSAQLDDRERKPEKRQHEMPHGQAAQPDEQVVGDDPADDRPAVLVVQPRQQSVDQESGSHRVGHREQRHEGGYEREQKPFL